MTPALSWINTSKSRIHTEHVHIGRDVTEPDARREMCFPTTDERVERTKHSSIVHTVNNVSRIIIIILVALTVAKAVVVAAAVISWKELT